MIFIRKDIINHKLKLIQQNLDLVVKYLPKSFEEFNKLELVKDGIYKRIESSIQEVLSICAVINADKEFGIPQNRDDIIALLTENNVISGELGKKIKVLKGFRNLLIYKYGDLQDDIAFGDIKDGLRDFQLFHKEIKKYLDSEK